MGKKDTITKRYLAQPKVFADAFNYFMFDGEQVIRPRDLKELDPTESSVIRKAGKLMTDQKMRDLLRLCTIKKGKNATYVLLGIEAQAQISYIMPVKNNLYDALNYSSQVETIRKEHKEAGDLKSGAEITSGFTKKDKIKPVITLCICFDKTKWDAPKSLHDMFGKVDPRLLPYINDYKLNLITPSEIGDFNRFSSELGLVMETIQMSDDKKRLRDIIESKEEYQSVDVDTVDLINAYTDSKISKKEAKGGKVNMCTAIQGLIEDGRVKGRAEGENKAFELIKLLKPGTKEYDKALNGTAADRRKLYKKYNIISG